MHSRVLVVQRLYGLTRAFSVCADWIDGGEQLPQHHAAVTIVSYAHRHAPGFETRPRRTALIDIRGRTAEAVFGSFNAQTRNKIHRTEHDGDLDFVRNDGDRSGNHDLYTTSCLSRGHLPDPPAGFAGCRWFSAYFRGRLIANLSCFHLNDILRVKTISSIRLQVQTAEPALYQLISCASRRVVFEACRYALDHDCLVVDLCGINDKHRGIATFKRGFGARLVDEYDYVYLSRSYRLALALASIVPRFRLAARYVMRGSRWLLYLASTHSGGQVQQLPEHSMPPNQTSHTGVHSPR